MADAVNTDDDRETKALDDATDTTAATDTDSDTDVSDEDLDPTSDDQPAGAKALTIVYDWLMEGSERLGGAMKMQENPNVKKMLAQWMDSINQYLDETAKAFAEEYPDEPPLSDQHTEEEEGDEEATEEGTADEGDADASGMKRKRQTARARAQKRLDDYRSKRLEAIRKMVQGRIKTKRMTKSAKGAINDAADHLDEMGGHEGEMTKSLKTASKYHAKELRSLCKAAEAEETKASDAEGDETMTKSLTPEQIKAAAQPLAEELAEKKIREIKARLDAEVATMKSTHAKILKEFKAARGGR